MKISELVAQLEALRAEHGDVDVKVYDFGLREPDLAKMTDHGWEL